MLDLETQIRNLADAAQAQSGPVVFTPALGAPRPRLGRRLGLALLALPIVIAVALALRGGDEGAEVNSRGPLAVDDPLAIDLGELIQASDGIRASAIEGRAYETFDFSEVSTIDHATTAHVVVRPRFDGEYVEITRLGRTNEIALVAEVRGRLDGHPIEVVLDDTVSETVEIRGHQALVSDFQIEWVEDGLQVLIRAESPRSLPGSAGLVVVARQLSRTVRHFDWAVATENFSQRTSGQPVLSGGSGNQAWQVVTDGDALVVATLDRGSIRHTAPAPSPETATIAGMPTAHTQLAYGLAPANASSVELRLADGATALLPIGQSALGPVFAIPLHDRLDPTEAVFLDDARMPVATISLDRVPPFLEGTVFEDVRMIAG